MNYTKPTVEVLGDASALIENMSTVKPGLQLDGDGSGKRNAVAAYDLDE